MASNYTITITRPDVSFVAAPPGKAHVYHKDAVDAAPRVTLCGLLIAADMPLAPSRAMSSAGVCKRCLRTLATFGGIEYAPEVERG